MIRPRNVAAAVVCATLGACAGEQAMRDTAAISARIVNGMETETDRFVARQNELNEEDAKRLQALRQARATLGLSAQTRLAGWRAAGDGDAVAMREALTAPPWTDVLAGSGALATLRPPAAPHLTPVDAAPFDNVVRQLNELSAAPSLRDRVQFLVSYGRDVNEAYRKSVAKAADDAKAAGDAGAKATGNLVAGPTTTARTDASAQH
jgi:hypothetical protein